MYAVDQQRIVSAKHQWAGATSAQRNQMLIDVGYTHHRTLTLRPFESLPIEVLVDLNFRETMRRAA